MTRGECTLKSDGACSATKLFEIWGGFHPMVTEVVPVGGGVDENAEFISINRTSR